MKKFMKVNLKMVYTMVKDNINLTMEIFMLENLLKDLPRDLE